MAVERILLTLMAIISLHSTYMANQARAAGNPRGVVAFAAASVVCAVFAVGLYRQLQRPESPDDPR